MYELGFSPLTFQRGNNKRSHRLRGTKLKYTTMNAIKVKLFQLGKDGQPNFLYSREFVSDSIEDNYVKGALIQAILHFASARIQSGKGRIFYPSKQIHFQIEWNGRQLSSDKIVNTAVHFRMKLPKQTPEAKQNFIDDIVWVWTLLTETPTEAKSVHRVLEPTLN